MHPLARRIAASMALSGLGVSLLFFRETHRPNAFEMMVAALPLVAALLALSSRFAAIVIARAIAWVYLVTFFMIAWGARSVPAAAGCIASAIAIAALGSHAYEAAADAVGFRPLRGRPVFLAGITGTAAGAIVLGVPSALILVTSRATSDMRLFVGPGLIAIGLASVVGLVTHLRAVGVALAGVLSLATLAWAVHVYDPGEGGAEVAMLALFAVAPALWLVGATAWARWFPTASARVRPLPWTWAVLLAAGAALARALVH